MRISVNTPLKSGPSLAAAAGQALVLGIVLSWVPATAEPPHGRQSTSGVLEYLDRLDRPERDQDQKPAQVVETLDLKPGMAVADLGSGSGYFTRRFVEAVTEAGKVYAIDIEPEALKYVEESLVQMRRPYTVEFLLARPDNRSSPTNRSI